MCEKKRSLEMNIVSDADFSYGKISSCKFLSQSSIAMIVSADFTLNAFLIIWSLVACESRFTAYLGNFTFFHGIGNEIETNFNPSRAATVPYMIQRYISRFLFE
jgi:hypothetical protein